MVGYAVWVVYSAVKGRENPSVSVTLEVRRRASCTVHDPRLREPFQGGGSVISFVACQTLGAPTRIPSLSGINMRFS